MGLGELSWVAAAVPTMTITSSRPIELTASRSPDPEKGRETIFSMVTNSVSSTASHSEHVD